MWAGSQEPLRAGWETHCTLQVWRNKSQETCRLAEYKHIYSKKVRMWVCMCIFFPSCTCSPYDTSCRMTLNRSWHVMHSKPPLLLLLPLTLGHTVYQMGFLWPPITSAHKHKPTHTEGLEKPPVCIMIRIKQFTLPDWWCSSCQRSREALLRWICCL